MTAAQLRARRANGRRSGTDLPGAVRVSTVFLGLDHFGRVGEPVLWETMIFGGAHDGYQARYTSRRTWATPRPSPSRVPHDPGTGEV